MRLVVAIFLLWSAVPAVAAEPGAEPHVLQVRVVTDEADAALAILEEHARTGAVEPASWDRLWKSEGFVRLKKRSESFGAKDVEQGFRDFLTSAGPLSHVRELRQALETWKHLDATAPARRAGAYLPPGIPLRVTIYPVIKKSSNSFVFELATNPAMFMYIDPKVGPAKLENTLAHELHHVGIAGCPKPPDYEKLSAVQKAAFDDLGAFGEGLAMLAAAGGPDVHPHATSDPAAWFVWERDIANFNTDVRRLEAFFRDLLAGRLTGEEANKRLFSFIDAEGVPQGAFYTVGWKMAAMVERARGRDALVKLLCDPRQLLIAYNELAAAHPRSDGEGLAMWSPDFLAGLSGRGIAPSVGAF